MGVVKIEVLEFEGGGSMGYAGVHPAFKCLQPYLPLKVHMNNILFSST